MDSIIELGKLKFKLLFHGAKISDEELIRLGAEGYRVPSFVRTGASYGIEAVLENRLCVNIPLNSKSSIEFSDDFQELYIGDEYLCKVDILKNTTSLLDDSGSIKPNATAKICFDRLGITLYTGCRFKEVQKGCKFCGIDVSSNFKQKSLLTPTKAVQLVDEALLVPDHGIHHIMLSGGVLPGDEYGAKYFAETAANIKFRHPDLSIYIMIPAPQKNETLQYLIESGIDEIAMNIEVMDNNIRKNTVPGKDEIGINRYFSALEYLSSHLPKFGSRSILMGGVEPFHSTLKGVEELCKRGVMPIISYYRVVRNAIPSLFNKEEDIYQLWESAAEIADKHNMVIGPTCIPCQNNVIALPINENFRYY